MSQDDPSYAYTHNDVTNDDHSVNTTNVNNNNHIEVYHGSAATEKRQEDNREQYRLFCKRNIGTGFISIDTRLLLDDEATRLHISADDKLAIEAEVKTRSQSRELSNHDRETINESREAVARNKVTDSLQARLVAIADKTGDDRAQFYANLILAVRDPQGCINRYETRTFDSYWSTYWVYVAYMRRGHLSKAAAELRRLSDYDTGAYPDNISLLNAAGCLYDYYMKEAGEMSDAMRYLNRELDISPMLFPFRSALQYLATRRPGTLYYYGQPEIDFFLTIFGARKKPEPATRASATITLPTSGQSQQSPAPSPSVQPKATPPPTRRATYTHTIPSTTPTVPPQSDEAIRQMREAQNMKDKGSSPSALTGLIVLVVIAAGVYFAFRSCRGHEVSTQPAGIELFSDASKDPVTAIYELISVRGYTGTKAAMTAELKNDQSKREQLYATLKAEGFTDIGNTFDEFDEIVFGRNKDSEKQSTSQTAKSRQTSKSGSTQQPAKTADNQTQQSTQSATARQPASQPITQPITQPIQAAQPTQATQPTTMDGATACQMGLKYLNGNGVARDNATAFAYFRQAAEAGNVKGMYWLGWCYRMGRGTSKNTEQAKSWWRKAAAKGSVEASRGLDEIESLM
ncbi:MAG: hypothetical protein NC117_05525 [Pseudoflavonifractor sp.]|nr:hypothetical protein [Pseudoflavonifractor sp.]